MNIQPLMINQNQAIVRCNQGIKLIMSDETRPFRKAIPLNEMLKMPFHVYFMNQESELQEFNEAGCTTFNILSASDAIGMTARDVADKESAELSIQNDLLVIKTRRLVLKDELYTRLKDGYSFPALTYKFPWYNTDNQLLGVFGITIPLDASSGISLAESMCLLTKTGLLESPENALPGLAMENIYFTQSEKNILLSLIRGKTARAIGIELVRSRRTIEHHIENMKIKTNSRTKSELIEKYADSFYL